MPCGGIYPDPNESGHKCFHCHKEGADHFCEEWDGFLHGECVPAFLMTEEGRIVIAHGHDIFISPGWKTRETTTAEPVAVRAIAPATAEAVQLFTFDVTGKSK
jgi:hypothetical protein